MKERIFITTNTETENVCFGMTAYWCSSLAFMIKKKKKIIFKFTTPNKEKAKGFQKRYANELKKLNEDLPNATVAKRSKTVHQTMYKTLNCDIGEPIGPCNNLTGLSYKLEILKGLYMVSMEGIHVWGYYHPSKKANYFWFEPSSGLWEIDKSNILFSSFKEIYGKEKCNWYFIPIKG